MSAHAAVAQQPRSVCHDRFGPPNDAEQNEEMDIEMTMKRLSGAMTNQSDEAMVRQPNEEMVRHPHEKAVKEPEVGMGEVGEVEERK